jgi:hypothetical protein
MGFRNGLGIVGKFVRWDASKGCERVCAQSVRRHDYNHEMARGWESKSVEAQQEEASDKSAKHRPPMSVEEAARWREKESLRLSRQRVLQQLESSQNPRHRKLLEDALADLDEKLKK